MPFKVQAEVLEEVRKARCLRCGHRWIPKAWPPRRCARKTCGTPYWREDWRYEKARENKEARDA